jgi:hypothetical protein
MVTIPIADPSASREQARRRFNEIKHDQFWRLLTGDLNALSLYAARLAFEIYRPGFEGPLPHRPRLRSLAQIDRASNQLIDASKKRFVKGIIALVSAFGSGAHLKPEHYQIEYRGTSLPGGVIKARVSRTREGDTSAANSLLGSRDSESVVMMIISQDQHEVEVMETTRGASPRFYVLARESGVSLLRGK